MDIDGVARTSRGPTTLTVVRSDRQRATFHRQVRDALNHLYDPSYLQTHPLARLMRPDHLAGAAPGGKGLRRLLLEAIEALRPSVGGSASERGNRGYQILVLRYGEAMDPEEVQARLGIGRAAFYRGQKRATEALADYLWERSRLASLGRTALDPAAPPRPERDPPAGGLAVGSRPAYRMPVPLTSFIGREAAIAEVKRLLATTRLLTLTGAGGCGKTRLALRVAVDVVDAFPDGVAFVDLAPLADSDLLVPTIAGALGIANKPGPTPLATLVSELRPRQLLLVLDNCEHLIAGCATLAQTLLKECPQLQILTTSREALCIPGEFDWPVLPLAAPNPATLPRGASALVATVQTSEAGRLFLERATSTRPDVALTPTNARVVASIVWRLDGIPLAIELAAARVKHLGVDQIAARLDDRFRLLAGGGRGVQARHQTLRALVDWSYDLLTGPERALFRRLSVFAGGWTLEAVEGVGAGSGIAIEDVVAVLSRLVDQSLVILESGHGGGRYRLLETLRQYAWERLVEADEVDAARDRHLNWYLAQVEQGEIERSEWRGPGWVEEMASENDNLRAALAWCLEWDVETGLQIAFNLTAYWWWRGLDTEAEHWLESLLARATRATSHRARALQYTAGYAADHGDFPSATSRAEESPVVAREVGDSVQIISALTTLGEVVAQQGMHARGRVLLEEGLALARQLGDYTTIVSNLTTFGSVARFEGDYARAQALLEELTDLARKHRDRNRTAWGQTELAAVAHATGDTFRALALLGDAVAAQRETGHRPALSWALASLGYVVGSGGDYVGARELLRESLVLLKELGRRPHFARALCFFGILSLHEGAFAKGLRLIGAAEALNPFYRARFDPAQRADLDASRATAREALGEETFARAVTEGRWLTLEQAAAYAQEEVE